MRIDHAAFFNGYRAAFGKLTTSQVSGFEVLGRNMEIDPALTDLRYAAYMLATVKHECANTWLPIVERGPRSYFDQYEPGTAKARRLGNIEPGDGFRFRGRGYVQITGRANYARMTGELRLPGTEDLEQDPEQALRPAIAYRIMSVGMIRGLFTGKKLGDYISGSICDYKNARRIINGVDQAALIAEYAQAFEGILKSVITIDVVAAHAVV
jgi:putative chitinase